MPKSKDPRLSTMSGRVRAVVDGVGSIAEAARRTGIPVNTVSRMCSGVNEPGVFVMATFARGMRVPLDYLLGLSDDPVIPGTAETAAPAADARAAEPGPPPLDENRLEELIQSALVTYGDLPTRVAAEVARSLLERARARREPRAAPPAPARATETPASPGEAPGPTRRP